MTISRRSFLVGSASMLAAGAAAAGIGWVEDPSERERILAKLGLDHSPDASAPPSGAREVNGSLTSRFMHRSVSWTITRPGNGRAPRGILYCLHGKGEDHRAAFDVMHIPDVAAQVGVPVAVAAVDGGVDSYWHRRVDGTDALAMLMNEFVPIVRHLVGPLPQAIMGWSMGGYGSLLAVERHPTQFRAVCPTSPALWLTPGATAPGAFDSAADYYRNDVFGHLGVLRELTVQVDCGTGDPFYPAAKQLSADIAFPHKASFGPGFHDASYWRSVAPAQLRTIGGALGL